LPYGNIFNHVTSFIPATGSGMPPPFLLFPPPSPSYNPSSLSLLFPSSFPLPTPQTRLAEDTWTTQPFATPADATSARRPDDSHANSCPSNPSSGLHPGLIRTILYIGILNCLRSFFCPRSSAPHAGHTSTALAGLIPLPGPLQGKALSRRTAQFFPSLSVACRCSIIWTAAMK
jgi:hypothetical protein